MIKTLADLRSAETPPWIWEGILLPSGLTLLSAFPKVGKTTFIAYMLRAMWTDDMYMGLPIRPVPTLVISEEADTLIASRADALGYSDMWPIGWMTPEMGRSWDTILLQIRHYAHMYHNPLIIIDTLSRHWGIDDENDNAKVERAMGPLIAIARGTGASLLLVHHTRKSGGSGGAASRGGGAIVGAVDIILELDRVGRGDKTNKRKIESYSRYGETPGRDEPMVIQLSEEGYVYKPEETAVSDHGCETEVRHWLLANEGWWQAAAISVALGRPIKTVRDALDLLVHVEQSIYQKGKGGNGHAFIFSAREDDA